MSTPYTILMLDNYVILLQITAKNVGVRGVTQHVMAAKYGSQRCRRYIKGRCATASTEDIKVGLYSRAPVETKYEVYKDTRGATGLLCAVQYLVCGSLPALPRGEESSVERRTFR